jgi:signal transduction histidine kinase/DNA-binding response OmpR family regulator
MQEKVPSLCATHDFFVENKEVILRQWVDYSAPKNILESHDIDLDYFISKYASGVFDYFMGVISGEVEIGHCPVMQELLTYLKKREISADELFEICSHFRRSMIDFSYDAKLNSKELFDEISYIFDENFKGILKFYTDTIFQKLIDARQDALRASEVKEYFLSNMSHEIRTPLNAILGFVNLLLDEDVSKKQRDYIDIIHSSGENLLSIINDILDFSKLRSGEFNLEYKNFLIHEELSHTMELFVASANVKYITIICFIDPNIPKELHGDSLRIKQVLSNFLSNAIKFTPDGGIIKVEVFYLNSKLKINVTDNGIGICEEDIKKIFTAFAQAQYSVHSNKGGTGLGLSICHQLAQKMDGEVGVVSEEGKGSTFSMEIPIETATEVFQMFSNIDIYRTLKMALYARESKLTVKHESFLRYAKIFKMDIRVVDSLEADFDVALFVFEDLQRFEKDILVRSDKKFIALMTRDHNDFETYENINSICFPLYCSKIEMAFEELLHPSKVHAYNKNAITQYKGHILIAEDNEDNQELIKIIIKKYGLSFDLVENGLEAFKAFKNNKYNLILMDQQMPIMNGNEAVRKIIQYENNNALVHTPIAALTANVIKGIKEKGLLSGYDAFLGKPLIIKELERVFQTYLEKEAIAVALQRVEESEAQKEEQIIGLDTKKLTQELMLSDNELIVLLKLFLKKMNKTLPELEVAISQKDYTKIALLAHSVKGSSGNFRIKVLQDVASKLEESAKNENEAYDYEESLSHMRETLYKINIK